MDFIFKKRDNEKYNYLIEKGFQNLKMGAVFDASKNFNEAKDLLIDPFEAHLGLAFATVLIEYRGEDWLASHEFTLEQQVLHHKCDKFLRNKDYLFAVKLSYDNEEFQNVLSEINEIIVQGKIEDELSKASAELDNYPNFSEIERTIEFFESVKSKKEEINLILIRLKEKYILGSLNERKQKYLDQAAKYFNEIKEYGDYDSLKSKIEEKSNSNKIDNLYSRGLLAAKKGISANDFELNPSLFIQTVTQYLQAVKNIKNTPYIKSQFSKDAIKRINTSVYKAILEYLPTYISSQTCPDPKLITSLKELVLEEEEHKQDIEPFIEQLESKKNSSLQRKPKKSLMDKIKSLFNR